MYDLGQSVFELCSALHALHLGTLHALQRLYASSM